MLGRLRRSLGGSAPGMSAALGALDEVLNPAAHRARELLEHDHERVVATPSPGDRLLNEGVLELPATPQPSRSNRSASAGQAATARSANPCRCSGTGPPTNG